MPAYLDYNASAPVDERVLDRMIEVYKTNYGNADSRTHTFGNAAKEIVSHARSEIATILNVESTELIFTSGSTESNNIAVMGLLRHALESGRNHFITTSIEHKAVLEPMKELAKLGCTVDFIDPDESGRVKTGDILAKVSEKTLLVSVMHVNSETGIIQPVSEIGEALSQTDTYFHIDATQSFGKMNSEIRSLKYDMLSFSGHKFGAPQGIGGLVIRRRADYKRPPVAPLFLGGQQERGFRPGTTPVALIAGLAKAASLCEMEHEGLAHKCAAIKALFMESISQLNYKINGSMRYCVPGTINVSFPGVDAEGVFVALKDDYAFSNGSACTSGSFAPSYVLKAMGLEDERISSALRLSWDGRHTVDFTKFIDYIKNMS
jgi:cysteine desulfurase